MKPVGGEAILDPVAPKKVTIRREQNRLADKPQAL
jgi:hypothetical protein